MKRSVLVCDYSVSDNHEKKGGCISPWQGYHAAVFEEQSEIRYRVFSTFGGIWVH